MGNWSLVNLINICLQCLLRTKSRVPYFMYFFISFCMISSWSTYSKMYGVCISIPMLPNIVTVRNTISRSRSKTLATNFQSSSTVSYSSSAFRCSVINFKASVASLRSGVIWKSLFFGAWPGEWLAFWRVKPSKGEPSGTHLLFCLRHPGWWDSVSSWKFGELEEMWFDLVTLFWYMLELLCWSDISCFGFCHLSIWLGRVIKRRRGR